ncbi:MAG: FKBP-type peptidyl-prolyl cis-trans isomerase [Bacteroidales bacterium]|nr:FKBP-type peptidyl-prolyl cis-trans isomerase [Bacteroidales bacterium]
MKHNYIIIAVAALTLAACTQDKTVKLNDMTDTLSWAMGENIGLSLKNNESFKLDNDKVIQAIRHTLEDNEQPINDTVYQEAIQLLLMQAQSHQRQTISDIENAQEEYFTRLMKEKPQVKKHDAGFYYEEIKKGHGANAKYAQEVLIDYRSFLMLTGEPYDQTYGKREPVQTVIGQPMFKGLIEGLQLMNEGSIYRFYFPYQLIEGTRGTAAKTPFIYEVELHKIGNN